MATKDKQEKQDKQEGKSEKAGFASQVEALFVTFYEGSFQMLGTWCSPGMRSVTSAKVRLPWTGSQYQSFQRTEPTPAKGWTIKNRYLSIQSYWGSG